MEDQDNSEAENSLFYFESDHLPLRGNADYSALLRTLVVLESQRSYVAKEIDELSRLKNHYIQNPQEFLKNVKEGNLGIPNSIETADIPEIDFKKYNVNIPEYQDSNGKSSDESKVRGRKIDDTKPETFNQLWTYEEQTKLEELLIEFPPEAVEMRRFEKIAKALGTRTVHQVASRVQKYFQKLHSAGMPVPGRVPKSRRYGRHNFFKTRKSMIKPSTFFPAHKVPVEIPETDEFGSSSQICISSQNPLKAWTVEEEKKRVVDILEGVKEAKQSFLEDVKHEGYSCDICSESPIIGIRWHCSHNQCLKDSVDFCSDCFIDQLIDKNKRHPLHHGFVPFGDYEDFGDDFDIDDYESEKL